MGDNVLVSFDEEKMMNDILDQGIHELKKSNPHAKSASFNKTEAINGDYDSKKDLIYNKKLANLNNNSNGSNDLIRKIPTNMNAKETENSLRRIDQIKGSIKEGIESKGKEKFHNRMHKNYEQDMFNDISNNNNHNNNIDSYNSDCKTNFNTYGLNHRKNLAELKSNYGIGSNNIINKTSDFIPNYTVEIQMNQNSNEINQDAHILSHNYNNANTLEAGGDPMLNDDTMQIMNSQTLKNNLINSNYSNTNSREERQIAKSSALRALLDEMKTKNTNLKESSDNLIPNKTSKNLTASNENRQLDIVLGNHMNMDNNYGLISQTARTNNLMTNDFLDTNTNNYNINNNHNYNQANHYNDNSLRLRNISVDSAKSNADLNFGEMKNEIDNLQSKIDGLEKKLLENTSSKESFEINFNTQSALNRIKHTNENLNNSKSSIIQSSKNKYTNKNNTNSKSPRNQGDSFITKNKHIDQIRNKNKNSLHKHSNTSFTEEKEDLSYRKKYEYNSKRKLNLKSKYGMIFESDCQNINTSQELSPLADRGQYRSPFTAKNAKGEEDRITNSSEKAERNNTSMCSKNSKNKLNASSNNNNNNNTKANKIYANRLNYSSGINEENFLRKSKSNVNTNANNDHSIISDFNNKSAEEAEGGYSSKRVADIITKTKSILGRTASREFRSKSKDLNKSSAKAKAHEKSNTKSKIITLLKREKASTGNLSDDDSLQEIESNDENYNKYNDDFSDLESKIKPKGFQKANCELSINKSKERRKKSAAARSISKSKSKNKSKSTLKQNLFSADCNYANENLLTFTHNNTNNTNLFSYYENVSRASSRKINRSGAAKTNASGIFGSNNILATGSNRSFSTNKFWHKSKISNSKITEQNNKEKILKLKERNNELKLGLKNERKKYQELEKKLKKIKFKEENFDCLEKNFIELQKEFQKMQKNHGQSELIRKEQAKLIKSMKYEIELLKQG